MDIGLKKQRWTTIVLCGLMILIVLGFCSANKGLYLTAICDALNVKRTVFSLSTSCRYITTAIVNAMFGLLVAKFGTKRLICGGFCAIVAAAMMCTVADSVAWFYVAEIFYGIGFSLTGTGMVGCVVNRCCTENKGTITGAILCANGVGGAIAAQIVTPLIYNGDPFGYRGAYRLQWILVAALLGAFLLLFREPKAEVEGAKQRKQGGGVPFAVVAKNPCFYAALACIFFTGFCLQGITGIAPAHMKDMGLSAEFVATASSVSLLVLTGSKFICGLMNDRLGLRPTITINCVATVACFLALAGVTASGAGKGLAMCYAVLSSIALPLETVMLPLYARDLFGERDFDKIMGLFISFNVAGYAVGTPFVNLGFDLFGSYHSVLLVTAGIMALVMISLQFVITAAHKLKDSYSMEEAI